MIGPSARRHVIALIVIGVALLVALGAEVRSGPLAFDRPVADALQALSANPLLGALNAIASLPVWTALVVLMAALLFAERFRRESVLLLLGLSAELATFVVKTLVDRPRPVGAGVSDLIASASFPSGHIVRAAVILGLLILVVGRIRKPWHALAFVASTIFIAALAVARVSSGEHWPSDVLGGLLLGAVWLWVLLLVVPGGGQADRP